MHRQARWWMLVLLVALLAVVPFSAAQESADPEIRAIWSVETFVLLNNSDSGVDVSALDFVSDEGAIRAIDWVLSIDPNTAAPYTLTDMRPGSCLLAYFQGTQPIIPETVSCTRIIGEFVIRSFDDIVWSIPQGGFRAEVDGDTAAECSIQRTSCDIPVPPAGGRPAEDAGDEDVTVPETQTIRAVWTLQTLVLINNAPFGVDLSELALVSEDGAALPENWLLFEDETTDGAFFTLDDVRPGSCLLIYLADTDPVLPDDVDCTRIIGEFTPVAVRDIVWNRSQGGFSPVIAGETGDPCPVTATSCDITVPTAATDLALNDDESAASGDDDEAATDPGLIGGATVRAVWTRDLLVLINISDQGADLSGLTLTSEAGRLTPAAWSLLEDPDGGFYTLDDVRPGSCLLAYPEGETAEVPATVSCTRVIAEAELADIRDVVWDVAQGGFEARVGEALSAVCAVEGTTSCDLVVPPAG